MAMNAVTVADAESADEPSGTGLTLLRALRRPWTLAGAILTLLFCVIAIIGPYIAPYDPSAVSNATLAAPSAAHWLGTTQTGQDVLSQMLYGTRTSMVVGGGAAVVATLLAIMVGLVSGYLGGLADELLSLLANVFLVLPSLPLAVILAAYLPHTGSAGIIAVISITAWAWGARILRAQTLSLRKRDFVEAARATGERTSVIIARDILPNQVAVIAALFLGTVTTAILTQASLAFLGLTDVTQWSWGTILYWAQASSALLTHSWWWFVPAGLAIAILGTSLSLVNFGIDEFINPRLRQAGLSGRPARRLQRLARLVRRHPPAPGRAGARRDGDRRAAGAAAPSGAARGDVVLQIDGLTVEYLTGGAATVAVNDVSLTLHRGEVLGIAGESGSGKSTLAYAITRLHRPPAEISSGRMLYTAADGARCDILAMPDAQLRAFRWEEMSIVFQSAMNALNPILPVGSQIEDAIRAHRPKMGAADRAARVLELLGLVGIPRDRAGAYPHELSGGMRQRALIAVGLALEPEIIVMDEPTTSLDVVIQRQIIEKIMELKDRLGFAVIFITHDLSLLIELSDTIAIMYAGRIVEVAAAADFYRSPRHPYSQGLLASFPTLAGPRRELVGIPGSPPDLRRLPSGCAFSPRCPHATGACLEAVPQLATVAAADVAAAGPGLAMVACVRYGPHAVTTGNGAGQPLARPDQSLARPDQPRPDRPRQGEPGGAPAAGVGTTAAGEEA